MAGPSSRRAKIVCTLGPSVDDDARLVQLIEDGMDAARLNLSFGDPAEHIARIERVRRASKTTGRKVSIIADIPGPKIRLGRLMGGKVMLERGAKLKLILDRGTPGDASTLPVSQTLISDELMRGDKVLLADGLVELRVTEIAGGAGGAVGAEVASEGEVGERTAVHVPSVPIRQSPVTPADLPLLQLAIQHDVDFIALTYVRDARDVLEARDLMERLGKTVPIIAKIERSEAFARLDGILGRADAVMIRRGDLGADIEVTRVPLVQKEVVRLANNRGVPVIIATQMLGSMIESPHPTRAEASDVSNAIADGADGVLLSSESAVGKYPVEALRMMDRIIVETERGTFERERRYERVSFPSRFPDTTARIACRAAVECEASLIACFTESGRTAGLVAKYRPNVPIIALCHKEATQRYLSVFWGVRSETLDPVVDVEEMVARVEQRLLETGSVRRGDRIVIVFGAPVGLEGHTNSVRLHEVGSLGS
jgi:pyruvate kinase